MTPKTRALLAALLAAGTATLALAQAPAPVPQSPGTPLDAGPAYVDAAIASTSRDDPVANAIAQALNAEASLKQSKITVQPDENGVVLLTGVAPKVAQALQAAKIASQHAGEGKVVNALATEEVVIDAPAPQPEAVEMAQPSEPEMTQPSEPGMTQPPQPEAPQPAA